MTFTQLLKSKTLWAGLATVCTGLGMFFTGEQGLQELVMSIIGVVFIVLRFYTTNSLTDK